MQRAATHSIHVSLVCILAASMSALGSAHDQPVSRSTSAKTAAAPVANFPSIESEALDRVPVTLPGQMAGRYNLLLLSWARDQGDQLESWTSVGQTLQHTYADMAVYRIPVNGPENFLFRWWDNASMRTDETDPESLRWTIPIYTDIAKLRHALGVPANDHQVLALLIDRSGTVLWEAQGASTAASRQSLLNRAQQLR